MQPAASTAARRWQAARKAQGNTRRVNTRKRERTSDRKRKRNHRSSGSRPRRQSAALTWWRQVRPLLRVTVTKQLPCAGGSSSQAPGLFSKHCNAPRNLLTTWPLCNTHSDAAGLQGAHRLPGRASQLHPLSLQHTQQHTHHPRRTQPCSRRARSTPAFLPSSTAPPMRCRRRPSGPWRRSTTRYGAHYSAHARILLILLRFIHQTVVQAHCGTLCSSLSLAPRPHPN